ncbi:MAG: AMP-binding protein, partial [bacterium]|nr:AMP-binding protein [bacterium]
KQDNGNFILLVDMHHIISDGTSHMLLSDDFFSLYNGEELKPLRLQYRDYTAWQNNLIAKGENKNQEDYWLDLYRGEIPRLNLYTDKKRPEIFSFTGSKYQVQLDTRETAGFRTLAVTSGGTLYMNILAAINTLFYKYSGQTDIIVGSGIAGRPHYDLQQIVGMFINTLAMRNNPRGDKNYRSFLAEVIKRSIQAFENQDVQFEELVEKLDPPRDPSRNPLFDISMVVQNFRGPGESGRSAIAGNSTEPLSTPERPNTRAKFDITFLITETVDNIFIDIEYYTGIFKPDTIQRLAGHFKNIVKTVIDTPDAALDDIVLISEKEKNQLLYEFNDTDREYPGGKNIHSLFEEQVERTPHRIAAVGWNPLHRTNTKPITYLAYRQLNRDAQRIAFYLLNQKNIRPGERVGVVMSQSLNRLPAILGILKAGAVYLPLAEDLPRERIQFMINDAGVGIILSEKNHLRLLNRLQLECDTFHSYLCMDSYDIHAEEEYGKRELTDIELRYNVGETTTAQMIRADVESTAPAYIIYTSGTTGKPKGVVLEHRGMANLNTKYARNLKINARDNIIQFANISFDASVSEIFMALLNGATLHLPGRETIDDYTLFRDYLDTHDITIATLPPPYVNNLVPESLKSLRILITAGSSPNLDYIKKSSRYFEYINAFGPTESTVCCSYWSSREAVGAGDFDYITIGKPISNTKLYITNPKLNLQPIGIAGQLCIAGVSLARGYLNNPELTYSKFIPITGKHSPSFL